jgi:hypothetical protein
MIKLQSLHIIPMSGSSIFGEPCGLGFELSMKCSGDAMI